MAEQHAVERDDEVVRLVQTRAGRRRERDQSQHPGALERVDTHAEPNARELRGARRLRPRARDSTRLFDYSRAQSWSVFG